MKLTEAEIKSLIEEFADRVDEHVMAGRLKGEIVNTMVNSLMKLALYVAYSAGWSVNDFMAFLLGVCAKEPPDAKSSEQS